MYNIILVGDDIIILLS